MIDGLALGETTPGPLIMVVTFVGFVGGWTRQLFGAEALFLAGAWRRPWRPSSPSCHPSCSFWSAGRWSRPRTATSSFTAPLIGITAAVVGVILNLALFFAWHVLWPQGFGGRFDAVSAVIAVAAAVALFRFKVGVLPLLGACAVTGLAVTLAAPLLR